MGIKIGDDNKIQNSMIAEKIDTTKDTIKKKTFFDKHPVICGFLISLVAGIVLLFSFWEKLISFLEGLF
jgi:hypothetical protein